MGSRFLDVLRFSKTADVTNEAYWDEGLDEGRAEHFAHSLYLSSVTAMLVESCVSMKSWANTAFHCCPVNSETAGYK
jgi:hypothetical protein